MQNNQIIKPNQRKLKVYSKFVSNSHKCVTLPQIKLCGKWLQNNGFECGQHLNVLVEPKKITITLISAKEGLAA